MAQEKAPVMAREKAPVMAPVKVWVNLQMMGCANVVRVKLPVMIVVGPLIFTRYYFVFVKVR